ncbi:hypothetical protein D3C87_766490 [compost metagenome]
MKKIMNSVFESLFWLSVFKDYRDNLASQAYELGKYDAVIEYGNHSFYKEFAETRGETNTYEN